MYRTLTDSWLMLFTSSFMCKETEAEQVVPVKPTQQLRGDLHPQLPCCWAALGLRQGGAGGNTGECVFFLNSTACCVVTDV